MVNFRVGSGKNKMSRKYLVVPTSKEVLKNRRMGACQRDTGANVKEPPMAKAGTI